MISLSEKLAKSNLFSESNNQNNISTNILFYSRGTGYYEWVYCNRCNGNKLIFKSKRKPRKPVNAYRILPLEECFVKTDSSLNKYNYDCRCNDWSYIRLKITDERNKITTNCWINKNHLSNKNFKPECDKCNSMDIYLVKTSYFGESIQVRCKKCGNIIDILKELTL